MSKSALGLLVALAVLAAAACTGDPTTPGTDVRPLEVKRSTGGTDAAISVEDLFGTWQATKAEAWSAVQPDSRRDLVAEGGTVTLVLGRTGEVIGNAVRIWDYTITLVMPGAGPSTDTGTWHYHAFWGDPQIDFYPSSLPEHAEYGEIPGFLVSLNGDSLKLWDSGLTFLPYDFGWNDTPGMPHTCLAFEFTRQ